MSKTYFCEYYGDSIEFDSKKFMQNPVVLFCFDPMPVGIVTRIEKNGMEIELPDNENVHPLIKSLIKHIEDEIVPKKLHLSYAKRDDQIPELISVSLWFEVVEPQDPIKADFSVMDNFMLNMKVPELVKWLNEKINRKKK